MVRIGVARRSYVLTQGKNVCKSARKVLVIQQRRDILMGVRFVHDKAEPLNYFPPTTN